jgi:hypothetical protein
MVGLSLLMPTVVAVCWWMRWPNLTAARFGEGVAGRDLETVHELMPEAKWFVAHPGFQSNFSGREPVVIHVRSVSDVLAGRNRFRLGDIPYDFVAERNTIHVPDKTKLGTILQHRAFVQDTTRELERLRLKRSVILLDVRELLDLPQGKLDRLNVYDRAVAMEEARLHFAVKDYEAFVREE